MSDLDRQIEEAERQVNATRDAYHAAREHLRELRRQRRATDAPTYDANGITIHGDLPPGAAIGPGASVNADIIAGGDVTIDGRRTRRN